MNALVLSGGALKGAFQAGAISYALQKGFVPEIVYGISAGALNGAFLADRSGRLKQAGKTVDWPQLGTDLESFWIKNITGPGTLLKKRSVLSIGFAVISNNFDGLVDTKPLRELVKRETAIENLRASPLKLVVGAVNMHDGGIVYADPSSPQIQDYIFASTAIPILMPLVDVNGAPHYDGGTRDIAPLGTAINRGATKILCIVCQAETLDPQDFKRGNLLDLAGRLEDVVSNETILNDLKVVDRLNHIVRQLGPVSVGGRPPYIEIPCDLIAPDVTLVGDIQNFTTKDVTRLIDAGKAAAKKVLG